jgi:hypothetical protein
MTDAGVIFIQTPGTGQEGCGIVTEHFFVTRQIHGNQTPYVRLKQTAMRDARFIEHLRQTFLFGNPDFDPENPLAFEPLGIRLVRTCTGYMNILGLPEYRNKPWVLKKDSYRDAVTNEYLDTRWNMSADGHHLARGFTQFFDVHPLDEQETRLAQLPGLPEEESRIRRLALAETLGERLIDGRMPFDDIHSGELETRYRVRLHMIQRDRHGNIGFKPQDIGVRWLRNKALSWGDPPGWDITADGRIACCHRQMGEYYNFLIQPLSDEQVAGYRTLYGVPESPDPSQAEGDPEILKAIQVLRFLNKLLDEVKADEKSGS